MADLSDEDIMALAHKTPVPAGWAWWRPVDLMRAAIAADRALNAPAPSVGAEGLPTDADIPPYGTVPWDHLKAAVSLAQIGKPDALTWSADYIGHQPAPMNMNSLNRVVSMFVARALASRPAVDAWQPIETAPKDGTLFLCWVAAERWSSPDGEGSGMAHDVSQIDFCSWRTQSDIPDCGWFDPCCGQIGDTQAVTHWMPLPAAPAARHPAQREGE